MRQASADQLRGADRIRTDAYRFCRTTGRRLANFNWFKYKAISASASVPIEAHLNAGSTQKPTHFCSPEKLHHRDQYHAGQEQDHGADDDEPKNAVAF